MTVHIPEFVCMFLSKGHVLFHLFHYSLLLMVLYSSISFCVVLFDFYRTLKYQWAWGSVVVKALRY